MEVDDGLDEEQTAQGFSVVKEKEEAMQVTVTDLIGLQHMAQPDPDLVLSVLFHDKVQPHFCKNVTREGWGNFKATQDFHG